MTPRPAEAIEIEGEPALCDASGALYFPRLDLLAVSDLHLEKGAAFARRRQFIPPYDTATTLARLAAVVAAYDPKIVVSLGDSFHDGVGAALMPDVFRIQLSALLKGRDWFWIAGNHDPDAPEGVGGESVQEIAAGPLVFRHEPSRGAAAGEIAGHLHPGARLVARGRSVRRRCFAGDGRRMIMPAFGAYTGMLNVLDRAYAGLFDPDGLFACMLGTRRVYRVAGSVLKPG
jgi:DNA ligase-associated metallophosphoesterase